MGVPARRSNVTTLALFAKDDTAKGLAREVLARDSHITLVEGDAPDSEQCSWAAAHGAELYAVAYVDAGYSSSFQCTKYSGGLLDKHEECVDGHETDQHTSASYTLTTYDAATCKEVPRLTAKFSARAPGEEEQSKPEALANLTERVRMKSEALPDQVTIDEQGRLAGDAHDGFYALYRNGQYRGYVKRHGESVTPMYWPMEVEPGDTLVERGRRKFLELAFDFTASKIEGAFAAGAGVHLRHYSLDGGFQFGVGADWFTKSADNGTMTLVQGEVGWGIPIVPGVVMSANLAMGRATLSKDGLGENGNGVADAALAVTPLIRVETFLATWFFVAVDAGVLVTGDFELPTVVAPISQRAAISRITAGFDL